MDETLFLINNFSIQYHESNMHFAFIPPLKPSHSEKGSQYATLSNRLVVSPTQNPIGKSHAENDHLGKSAFFYTPLRIMQTILLGDAAMQLLNIKRPPVVRRRHVMRLPIRFVFIQSLGKASIGHGDRDKVGGNAGMGVVLEPRGKLIWSYENTRENWIRPRV